MKTVTPKTGKRLQVCAFCGARRIAEPAPREADVLLANNYTGAVKLVRQGEFACGWHPTYADELAAVEAMVAKSRASEYSTPRDWAFWENVRDTLKANALVASGTPERAP